MKNQYDRSPITGDEPATGIVQGREFFEPGLTIRQQFAAMAMQGLLAKYGNPEGWEEREDLIPRIQGLVISSVAYADTLINELNKQDK